MVENQEPAKRRKQWLEAELTRRSNRYQNSAQRWRIWYRTLIVSSALLSAGAAVIVNLKTFATDYPVTDIASVLAALATVTTTLMASLNFEGNWRINRHARHQTDMLIVDLANPDANLDDISTGIKQIIASRLNDTTEV